MPKTPDAADYSYLEELILNDLASDPVYGNWSPKDREALALVRLRDVLNAVDTRRLGGTGAMYSQTYGLVYGPGGPEELPRFKPAAPPPPKPTEEQLDEAIKHARTRYKERLLEELNRAITALPDRVMQEMRDSAKAIFTAITGLKPSSYSAGFDRIGSSPSPAMEQLERMAVEQLNLLLPDTLVSLLSEGSITAEVQKAARDAYCSAFRRKLIDIAEDKARKDAQAASPSLSLTDYRSPALGKIPEPE